MKVRTFAGSLAMVAATLAFLVVLPMSVQSAETVTLKVADSVPPTHYFAAQGLKPWMDRVVQLSKTKVEFQYYPSEQLGKLADMVNILKTGVADVAMMSPTALAGDFPMGCFFALPGLFEHTVDTNNYLAKMLKEGPSMSEFTNKGFRPILPFALPNYEIFTAKKSIVTAEDLKGQKIRSSGAVMGNVLKALGASPVIMSSADLMVGMQRGTVDGTVFAYLSAKAYRVEEVAKYATVGANLSSSFQSYAISEKAWQKLPDDVQKAMVQADKEILDAVIKYQDKETLNIIADFEKNGVKINRLSKDEVVRWSRAVAPLMDEWEKDMEKKGLGKEAKMMVDAYKKAPGR